MRARRLACLSAAIGSVLLVWGAGCKGDRVADAGAEDAGAGDAEADAGSPVVVLPDEREPCADRDPLRRPFFGDLHVHTRYSFDAAAFGVRAGPEDAYRFARGEPIGLPPYDDSGEPARRVQLRRPLDFAAVTDHAEFLAETRLCYDPDSPGYDSTTCRTYRDGDAARLDFGELTGTFLTRTPLRPKYCRTNPDVCTRVRDRIWDEIREAADRFDDSSASCEFATFVAYEWSGTRSGGTNIHRNVIFRNRSVPRVPTSYIDAPSPDRLWDALDASCLDTGTPCDVLAIPHNSNVAGGEMFNPITEAGEPYTRAQAKRRAELEPLVEIYQHKGASECITGVSDPLASEDELCRFEQLHPSICTGGESDPDDCIPLCSETSIKGGLIGGCVEPADMVRGAWRTGLSELSRVGANPFPFGVIASTDTHNATAGQVSERDWNGHMGSRDGTPEARLRGRDVSLVGIHTNSAGGLAVLWAEENSRPALFDAMRRREAYATSGPRMVVRFFGGWDYPDGSCDRSGLAELGYERGVPMGGELSGRPDGADAPVFVVSALQDAGTEEVVGTPLQRIQIIKGWLGADGSTRERVYEVAGDPESEASVELSSCRTEGEGASSLCSMWRDPDFDPARPALYYARVLENPTCRWSHRLCLELDVRCEAVEPDDPLAACCDDRVPKTVQERAWTSPIWYTPPQRPGG